MKYKNLLIFGTLLIFSVTVYGQHHPGPGGPLRIMDINKDGKISKSEWNSHHNDRIKEFNQIDGNGDTYLSDMELRTFHMKKMRNHSRNNKSLHSSKGPRPPKHGHRPEKLIEKMDINNDGKISRNEWDSHHRKLFSDLDSNGDSNVVIGEFIKFHESMKGKSRKH